MKNIIVLSLVILITSCASRKEGWFSSDSRIELSKEEFNQTKTEALESWKKRHIKTDLEDALSKFQTLSNATEDNYLWYVYLTRGYYFLADAHYEDMELKKKYWELGTKYGEKAMATNKDFSKAMKEGDDVEDHLDKLGIREIDSMYWTAANLGKWAKNTGITKTLKYKNRIRTLISSVEKINPTYFYYAPSRYWGAYYSVAPSFAGGSMSKSKKNFEKTIKNAPTYLGSKVLYAQYYMVKKENKKEFKRLLNEVIKAANKDKNIIPENIIEKKKAQKLLAEMDDIF